MAIQRAAGIERMKQLGCGPRKWVKNREQSNPEEGGESLASGRDSGMRPEKKEKG